MDCFDMMRVDITKKDAFPCLVLVLLRGLVSEGRALLSSARATVYGVNRTRHGDLNDRQFE
jgi:hypothetical protein